MTKIELLIGGEDVAADTYTEVRDPGRVTEIVGLVAQASPMQMNAAIEQAHRGYLDWSNIPVGERVSRVLTAADVLTEAADDVVEIMARESGMLPEVNLREIQAAAALMRESANMADDFLKPQHWDDQESAVILTKRPLGVVAGIVPWNAPVILTMQKLAPALLCGNAIVVKPSPSAAMGISILLKKIAALFPPGVVTVVHGAADVGQALSTHPKVRKISFTGGGGVAKSIMRDASEYLKRIVFELGGNDPAIVLSDASIEKAVSAIVPGAFRRSGQFCFAVKRVYVHHTIYQRFLDRFIAEVDRYVIGYPLTPGVSFGPVNNANQYEYVKGLIKRARHEGADVVELGQVLNLDLWDEGYYLRPAIVRNADMESEIVQVEQFGPVLPIVPFDDLDSVVSSINAGELGLGSSIWSEDADRAAALAARIEAGMTFVNGCGLSRLGARYVPFGGVKASGIGRENTAIGMAEYINYHAINIHGN